jgi:hypothetical protein
VNDSPLMRVWSVPELARAKECDARLIRRLCETSSLPAHRDRRGRWVIYDSAVRAYEAWSEAAARLVAMLARQ